MFIYFDCIGQIKMAILCNLVFRSEIYNSIVSVNTLVDFIRPIQVDSSSVTHMTEWIDLNSIKQTFVLFLFLSIFS